jgi:hypothetical protein
METSVFIDKTVNKISNLGLTAPTILLLEAHKPLAFLGSQILLIFQPTLDIFFPENFIRNTAELLADSGQLEQLISKLEAASNLATGAKSSVGYGKEGYD